MKKVKDPKRISPDPRAWAKKYFIEASLSLYISEEVNRGIKDIRFNSRPNHTKTHWVLLKASIEPKIRVEENRVVNGI